MIITISFLYLVVAVAIAELHETASAAACGADGDACPIVVSAPATGPDLLSLAAPGNKVEPVTSVALNGARTPMLNLGPMVLKKDGRSYSRITNWATMDAAEQNRTRRVILRRNAARAKKARAHRAATELSV